MGEGQPGAPWPDLDRFLRGQGQSDRGYEACTKNMATKGGAPSEVCFYKRRISAIVAKIALWKLGSLSSLCLVLTKRTIIIANCGAQAAPDTQ